MTPANTNYTIYGLYFPGESLPRYIGATVLPVNSRLSCHMWTAENKPNASPIHGFIQNSGERPLIVQLETDVPPDRAGAAEKAWARHFANQGAPLLNRLSQLGANVSAPKRSKLSRSAKARHARERHAKAA